MRLSSVQWSRAEELFEAALKLPVEQRAAYLARACTDDPVLYEDVVRLVEVATGADEFLATPVSVIATNADETAPIPAGTLLGPWRIRALLGQGGMGEVYSAERADGAYEQQIALKLLKRGLDTHAMLARFLQERRILARLTHPNISRLLDAGSAPDGRPYLAMEQVDGQPITQWCRERGASLRKMIELGCEVCEAVQSAHRICIVHRDLKPSNVLVADSGEIKLLDFGVAKLLNQDAAEATQAHLAAPLTPQYAAPEQLLGDPVSPATDVYALGSLLYEMFTGVPARLHTNAVAAAAALSLHQSQLVPPSRAVLQSQNVTDSLRRSRARELDGDLDLILMKALSTDPARRYPSAVALSEDLQRHLDGRPVLARPDSWTYQAKKFVQRNRVSTALASVALVALVAGLTVSLWQAHAAQREARRANAVRDFIETLFEPIRGGVTAAREPSLKELVTNGVQRLDETTLGPAERVDLLLMFSRLNEMLGDRDRALVLAERASSLAEVELGTEHPLAFEALVTRGLVILHQDRLAHAEPLLMEAERRYRDDAHSGMPLIRLLDGLAVTAAEQGRTDQALQYGGQALQKRLALFGPDSLKVSVGYNNLGYAMAEAGDFDAAVDAYRHALAINRKHLAPDSFEATVPLANMGAVQMFAGHLLEGRESLLSAKANFDKAQGKPRPQAVYNRGNLCTAATAISPIAAADTCADVLTHTELAFGKESASYGRALRLSGLLQLEQGNLDAAYRDLAEARRLAETNEASGLQAQSDFGLGELQILGERWQEAAITLAAAVERFGSAYPAHLRRHALALLALSCHSGATQGCAGPLFEQAKNEIATVNYRWSPFLLPAHVALARVELQRREPAAARERLRNVIKHASNQVQPMQPRLVNARLWLAVAEARSGNCVAASTEARSVLNVIEQHGLRSHPVLAAGIAELGRIADPGRIKFSC